MPGYLVVTATYVWVFSYRLPCRRLHAPDSLAVPIPLAPVCRAMQCQLNRFVGAVLALSLQWTSTPQFENLVFDTNFNLVIIDFG
jgi:hypothetical protein